MKTSNAADTMKKYLTTSGLVLMALLSSTLAFAQIDVDELMRDKPFDKITELYGQPLERVEEEGHGGSGYFMWLTYEDMFVVIDTGEDVISGISFWTDELCVLSSYVEGGIKVGDRVSALKDVDFDLVTYGSHTGRCGLVPLKRAYTRYPSRRLFNYCILSHGSPYRMDFAVEDDIIKEISVAIPEDGLDPEIYADEENTGTENRFHSSL